MSRFAFRQIRIVPARPCDAEAMVRLEDAADRRFDGLELFSPDMPNAPAEFAASRAADGLALAAWSDKRLVGMAWTSLEPPFLYLDQVSVHPDFGGRGIGARLMEAVEDIARARGLEQIALSTFRDAPPWNGPWYRKLGYEEWPRTAYEPWMMDIEERQKAYLDVAKRCFMVKRLTPAPRKSRS